MVKMDARNTAFAILIAMAILSYALWYYADGFAKWTMVGEPLVVTIVYLLTNPDHLAILAFMTKSKGARGALAGFFVISAFDIASWAHYITLSGALPGDPSSYVGLDTIIYKVFYPNFPLGTFGLYVVLPVLLMVVAYEILFPRSFVSLIKRAVGV